MTLPNTIITELERIISNQEITIVFQPIFNTHDKVPLGYEALTRLPQHCTIKNPTDLFEIAYQANRLSDLELLCRKKSIEEFARQRLSGYLFLNVSPYTLTQQNHPKGETLQLLKQVNMTPENVVIEVSERFEALCNRHLKSTLQHYRDLGFKIAIDDLGTGNSGLKQWAELQPDIVKIDRYFITGCQHNVIKRELLRTIFELGRSTDVIIIAEGIEQTEEYALLDKMGMQFAQGYLFGKPAEKQSYIPPTVFDLSSKKPEAKQKVSNLALAGLTKRITPSSQYDRCSSVYDQFGKSASSMSLAIVDELNHPVGIIYKDKLAEIFSSNYGRALYNKKPILELMEPLPYVVDIYTPIDEVSKLISANKGFDLRPEFIVVEKNSYRGIANIRSLLKVMTEEKIKHAQHSNPLTMLPGNIVIEERVNQFLQSKSPFQMAYFDLNNFKPFNDLYGYVTGDTVIKIVADVISIHCQDNFVGHVGGDDFVVLFGTNNPVETCSCILALFRQRISTILNEKHLEQKGYYALNRKGEKEWFSLLSLSCGLIKPDVNAMTSHLHVSQMATIAKKRAKIMAPGEVYVHEHSEEAELVLA